MARSRRTDEGSATVELAAAIPILVVLTVGLVGVIAVAGDQVLAQGAAREGAREAALSSSRPRAAEAVRAALPPGRAAQVDVSGPSSGRMRVAVRLPVRLLPALPAVVVHAVAVAAVEPGSPPPPAGP